MLCNLQELLAFADAENHGLAAFNVYGYEDGKAVVTAAEKMERPVVLMANKDAVGHMGIDILAKILISLANDASVPVGVHLDHATNLVTIKRAINAGFTSVMFDGSQLSYEDNVRITRKVMLMAEKRNVSVEAEIGAVGYSDKSVPFQSRFTDPEEAYHFWLDTRIDALAVAVGTVHRMEVQEANLQFGLLREIKERVDVPLVIHGATGVTDEDLTKLVAYGAKKINLGTTLRMAFGESLRKQMEEDEKIFDRIVLFKECMKVVEEAATKKMEAL